MSAPEENYIDAHELMTQGACYPVATIVWNYLLFTQQHRQSHPGAVSSLHQQQSLSNITCSNPDYLT